MSRLVMDAEERIFRAARFERWLQVVAEALEAVGLPADPWEWTEEQRAEVEEVIRALQGEANDARV